ncbi:MAG: YceH family protein, partial [Pseudomonadota bacterium]
MIEALDPIEQRIIGCLLEKSVTTPDQYPLTLNALIAACNQKSSREPVMKLTPGEVEGCANRLAERHLVVRDENFKSRVTKYSHRFCNTPFGDLELDPPAYAILTLMLLRGPQTPGELRARSPRLHVF